MRPVTVLHCYLLTNFSLLLLFFISISLCINDDIHSLYIACDYAEEYSSIVKKYLTKTIYTLSAIYVLLMIDGLPFLRCLFGIITHLSYLTLLPTFPFVQPMSIQTICCFVLTLLNHLYWFHFFVSEEYRYSIHDDGVTNAGMKVLGFLFIFVWITPIGFFVSLQNIEDSLPMMNASATNTNNSASSSSGQHKKGGIFKGLVDAVLVQKERLFPGMQKRQY